MMNWYRESSMGGWGLFAMSLIWLSILFLGIWVVTAITKREKVIVSDMTPRQILDKRFASGDISAQEYSQAVRLINGHGDERETEDKGFTS